MKKIKALAVAGVFTASLAATAFAEMAEVKVGGEIRVRDVITNNYSDFDKDAGDRTNVVTSRTRVNVDAKVNETTKAYISLQDTRAWGTENDASTGATSPYNTATTGNDKEAVDVSQAYLQLDKLFGQPLSLKLGRQQLAYGEHRLIGNFEWSNYGRRFDGLKLMYNTDAFGVDIFTMKVKEAGGLNKAGTETPTVSPITGKAANADNSDDGYFNGIYATVKTIPANTLDLYLLQKKDTGKGNFGEVVDGQDILTYGLRLNGAAMNIDWTAEAAWQSGDYATDIDQKANMYALRAGYTIPDAAALRIGAEYAFASGDDGTDATENNDFDNLYPTNHPLYGVSDVIEAYTGGNALSDLKAWSINIGAKPVKGLKLLAEYWDYQSAEEYAPGSDKIGTEFNIQAWYAINENVDLHAFWARFSPDKDLADPNDEADNVTVQLAVKF